MKKRAPFLALIVLMVALTLALAGCNRERPAPTSTSSTPTLKLGTLTPAPPGAAVTKVTLPSQTGQPSGAATPVPLTTGSPAAPTAASLSTSAPPAAAASKAPASEATPARSAGDSSYVIQRGDTLAKIATRYGVTVKQLTDLNGIKNPNMIVPGQTLKIPGTMTTTAPAATSSSSGSQKTYTVQAGDNLAGIAAKFGVTIQALQQTNNLSNPDQIYTGQILKIP
jgi:LysM repeat protein